MYAALLLLPDEKGFGGGYWKSLPVALWRRGLTEGKGLYSNVAGTWEIVVSNNSLVAIGSVGSQSLRAEWYSSM